MNATGLDTADFDFNIHSLSFCLLLYTSHLTPLSTQDYRTQQSIVIEPAHLDCK